jgi:hypothetical protein
MEKKKNNLESVPGVSHRIIEFEDKALEQPELLIKDIIKFSKTIK